MKLLTSLIAALLCTATASAQPIFGHPQKAAYGSLSEWPTISGQCHWVELPEALPDGSNSQAIIEAALGGTVTSVPVAHTHLDVKAPIYSEITGLLRVPFTIKAFQTAGTVTASLDRQELVTKIEWDETGSEVAPVMRGDPTSHALRQWPGHFTIDPHRNVGGHGFPDRGWYSPQIEIHTNFDSGAETLQLVRLPFYSMLNPAAPDGSLSGVPLLIASCYPHSVGTDEWGTNFVETGAYIPLAPISVSWPLWMDTTSYGGRDLGDGIFEQRFDQDLHTGNLGQLASFQPEAGFTSADRAPVLSPALMGPGPHKVAFIWSKPRRHFEEIVSALLVIDVTVDPNAPPPPPPPVCVPPQVLVGSQCVDPVPPPPPPPPTEEWRQVFPLYFEDFINGVSTGKFKVCFGSLCFPVN